MSYSIKYRRRREGKTNYHKRLKLLQSGETRLVVRKSNTGIVCQFVTYQKTGDAIVAQANAKDLQTINFTGASAKSLPGAYLIGYAAGKRAKAKGVTTAIVDLGMHAITKGNRVFAAVKGAIDAGVEIPVSEEILPSKDRIEGKHIQDYRNVQFNVEAAKTKFK